MYLDRKYVPIIGVGVIILAVAIGLVSGTWVASGREEIERKISRSTLAAEDIKGWMTIAEVAETFDVGIDQLKEASGIPEETPETVQLRDLEQKLAGYETENVRDAVRRLTGRANSPDKAPVLVKPGEDGGGIEPAKAAPAVSAVPAASAVKPAATVLKPPVTPSKGAAASLDGKSARVSAPATTGGQSGAAHDATQSEPPSSPEEIKGRMTLAEIGKAFQVPVDYLIKQAGLPADADANKELRDFKETVDGFEVQVVRDAVAGYLASK